jgi:hypothetical protein
VYVIPLYFFLLLLLVIRILLHHRGSLGPSLASRCCLHTRKSRRSAPLYCMVMAAQDPARSPVPARAIFGCCGHCAGVRERVVWIVNPASLWTASGPQRGSLAVHMLEVCPQALRAGSAPPVCHLFLLF